MTYLIVGLDRRTLAPWHQNIRASDASAAKRIAHARAASAGLELVVAAVVGPGSDIVADAA